MGLPGLGPVPAAVPPGTPRSRSAVGVRRSLTVKDSGVCSAPAPPGPGRSGGRDSRDWHRRTAGPVTVTAAAAAAVTSPSHRPGPSQTAAGAAARLAAAGPGPPLSASHKLPWARARAGASGRCRRHRRLGTGGHGPPSESRMVTSHSGSVAAALAPGAVGCQGSDSARTPGLQVAGHFPRQLIRRLDRL